MHTPFAFLRFVGRAVANALGAGLAGDFLIDVLPEVAKDVWAWWGRDRKLEDCCADIQAVAQAGSDCLNEHVVMIVAEVAGDKSIELQKIVAAYLSQVPASVRKSLRRPTDPTGTTISPALVPKGPDDLLRLLPNKLPRFKPGDRPLVGVDYELEQLLGVGGFGEVWKARNPQLRSAPPVALKFCLDTQAARVLRNEAAILDRVMNHCDHSGIVRLQHTYLSAETPCLQYEFVEGGDLSGLIQEWHRANTGFSVEDATTVVHRLAEIVGAAHRSNPPIVHRDLKPANILVQYSSDQELRLKVADFGIGGAATSRAIRETVGVSQSRFLASAVQGAYTPLYASPQQMRGESPDPRDDVFAIGVVWYQMLTGDLTCGRPGGSRWRMKLAERGVPPELSDLLETCFEDNPNDRPGDAAELAERLGDILSHAALAHFDRGNAHLENGEWAEAIADYSEFLRLNPKNSEAYKNRGHAFCQEGEYDEAIVDFTKVIQLNPQDSNAHCKRGFAQFKKGHFLKAIDDYNQAIRLDPQDAEAYCNLGLVYFEKRDYERAVANLKTAIRFNSNHAEAYYRLGLVYAKTGKTHRAITNFTEAIRLNPNHAAAFWERAMSYEGEDMGEDGRAISDYSTVIRLQPDNAQAYLDRGDALRDIGLYERANADYCEAIRLSPEDKKLKAACVAAYCKQAEDFFEQGDKFCKRDVVFSESTDDLDDKELYAKAITCYNMARRLDAEDKDVLAKCVAAYCRQGDRFYDDEEYGQAITSYAMAIELDPENKTAKQGFAGAGYWLNPQDHDTRAKYAVACRTVGDSFFEMKRFSDAFTFYNMAIELNPADKDTKNRCGLAYRCSADERLDAKQYNTAIEEYTQAINLDKENASLYRKRGEAYLGAGGAHQYSYWQGKEFEKALVDFTDAIRLNQHDPIAYSNRAKTYRAMGDETNALNDERMAQALTQAS